MMSSVFISSCVLCKFFRQEGMLKCWEIGEVCQSSEKRCGWSYKAMQRTAICVTCAVLLFLPLSHCVLNCITLCPFLSRK